MSLSRPLLRSCDFPGCAVVGTNDSAIVHHVMGGTEDFCTEHYPLPKCADCQRRMRPYRSTVGEWPGTALKKSTTPPLCGTCFERRKREPRRRGQVWTCHCGATTYGKTSGWWLTKYYGPLCPAHVHPLCGGCFKPVHPKTDGPIAGMVKYSGRGICQLCQESEKVHQGRNVRRVVLALPEHTVESAREVVPQDLWDMVGISPTQKAA